MVNPRVIAWSMWLIASFFYAYQYILRVMPNIMMTDITNQFHIDATVFGQFSGVYYLGYSLIHIPIGIMLDRFGPRKVMTVCIMLTVLGLLPILVASHWIYPLIGRGMIGIGSSAAILGTFKIIRMGFADRYFSRMLSFSVMIGLIGAIYGGGPVSYLCSQWGYKSIVQLFVLTGLLLAIITYLVIPKNEESSYSLGIWNDVKEVLGNKRVLLFCFFAGLMLGPLEGFSDVWGSGFFEQVYGYDRKLASYLPSIIFLGMCFGSPVLSLIAEKSGYYTGTIITSGIIMFVVFSGLVLHALSLWGINIGLLFVGICCAYQILVIYKVSTFAPERLMGISTAVANMIIMIFGYAFHSFIGFIISTNGGIDDSKAYIYGVSVIPTALLLGIVGFLYCAYNEKYRIVSAV